MASTARFSQLSQEAANQPVPEDARRTAEEIMTRWSRGEPADASAALDANPELRRYKSVVLQLAYEEYCRQGSAGSPEARDELLGRFPTYANSLKRLLDVHEYYQEQTAEPVAWPACGERWLGFELQEQLGRGAFARVFLAHESALGGRLVVLKIARQSGFEAEVLGRLEHAHIVPVHSVATDPKTGLTGIVMPYLGRDTLADWLDERSAAVGASQPARQLERANLVLSLGAALGEALSCTHAHGVLHQDLKPSNVLLARDGRPMLLDFNLATQATGKRAGGTLPYMAPEQLELLMGRNVEVDERCDVFGLGVLLYELLTGELPFGTSSTSVAAQRESRDQSLKPLETRLTKAAGARAARTITACLAADPAQRPQSAADLATQLRRLVTWPVRAERWVRLRPRLTASLAAICAMLVAGAAVWASVQPPAHIQAFQQGAWHYRRGEYVQAAEWFGKARDAGHPAASVARGRANLRRGEKDLSLVSAAIQDFNEVPDPNNNLESMLQVAQCHIRLSQFGAADALYQQAIDKGASSPLILHNLGCIRMQASQWPEAIRWFDQAVAAEPRLQLAYACRAMAKLNQALAAGVRPDEAIADIEHAISLGTAHPHLLRDAGAIHAVAARFDPAHISPALEYLEKAVDQGFAASTILKDTGFRAIAKEPRFLALASRPAPAPAPNLVRFADLFDDEAFFVARGG